MATTGVPTTPHLQGLVTRKTATAEPKTLGQYFNHVADVVRVNEDLTALRMYNLKRKCNVSYHGYEAVLNRKKRASVRLTPSTTTSTASIGIPYGTRVGASSAATAATPLVMPSYIAPARPPAIVKPPQIKPAAPTPPPVIPATPTPVTVRPSPPALSRRNDFPSGTNVMIRNTADLVACGARNLVGKMGRIVSVPQIYGQELYSVYIDEHDAVFQVPFNALTLIGSSTGTTTPQSNQSAQKPNASAIPGVQAPNTNRRSTQSLEEIKMEHSFQLHRLMQQQYREIQVLQQQYAECRLVNPAALTGIQKELSKLRLVHLSQVQTLKSKQALDLLGK